MRIDGRKLQRAREQVGLTQRQLAEESGVSLSAISHYEQLGRGRTYELQLCCAVLGIELEDIEIDAPEGYVKVIHCRNCKHWDAEENNRGGCRLPNWNGDGLLNARPGDYCSYAEAHNEQTD